MKQKTLIRTFLLIGAAALTFSCTQQKNTETAAKTEAPVVAAFKGDIKLDVRDSTARLGHLTSAKKHLKDLRIFCLSFMMIPAWLHGRHTEEESICPPWINWLLMA